LSYGVVDGVVEGVGFSMVLVVVDVVVVGVPVVADSRVVVVSVVVVSRFWQPTANAAPRTAKAARVRNFFMLLSSSNYCPKRLGGMGVQDPFP
jgi:hypothetical protein